MIKTKLMLAVLVTALSAGLVGCEVSSYEGDAADSADADSQAAPEGEHSAAKPVAPSMDIVDTAVAAGSFKTLAAAVQAAGLVETLKSDGPFTVFAPTDEAFANLPEGTVDSLLLPENKDQLVAVLTYHVVPGRVDSSAVTSLDKATTVQGADLMVDASGEGVRVNGANVVKADIECSNGIIHVIDAVVLPPAEGETAGAHPGEPLSIEGVGSFKTLFAAIDAAGLRETLAGGGFTIFAPTDEAFAALPEGTLETLLKPENKDQLVSILTYHVIAAKVPSGEVVNLTSAKTVNGAELPIAVSDGTVTVGSAQVLKTDVECEVGLIHAIDGVLLP